MDPHIAEQKTCFVVQGYGVKTDFTDGRKLNLDASYQVIKEAVEKAGLRCIRADEVVKSGTIDIPMYEWILKADLVIADLSTYNVNAAYELGVRYGVAPSATIILAEDKFNNPFDFSHIVLHRYKHLGEDIGLTEARRFTAYLADIIRTVIAAPKPDSPLYEFFDLHPPKPRRLEGRADTSVAREPPEQGQESAKALLDRARAAMDAGRFVAARELLFMVHSDLLPNDPYVLQQLALATYKSRDPDPERALADASHILRDKLKAETSNDPETLGLWGAVHKRLWDLKQDRTDLDTAIGAYQRGFYLKQDYYNGINLAFLLNVRAAEYQRQNRLEEAVADFVLARRIRREVIPLCEASLAAGPRTPAEKYWLLATLWEAAYGLEDQQAIARWQPQAEAAASAPWMLDDSTRPQLAKLEKLLAASPLKQLPRT